MKNKKILIISCAIFITLLAGGVIAATKLPGITPEKAKGLDYRPVKLQDVVPCDQHPVFNKTPACQKDPGKQVKNPNNNQTQESPIKYNQKHKIYKIS